MNAPTETRVSAAPYPGLRPFNTHEVDIFFGREGQTDQLLARLQRTRFLAVVGPSGCGKSSLVRAGMIASLETGFLSDAGSHWRIAEMRPGDHPLARLAEALLTPSALGPELSAEPDAPVFLQAMLRRGPLGLVEIMRETPPGDGANLLILVDQFEEIFRFRREVDADEADAFVALLLASTQHEVPIYVVITMRSDFLGDAALFASLPEALNDSQFLTPRLTREQCQAAIEKPARVFGGTVEPALVNRLLNDMGSDPDWLPLLQHTLMRMWTRVTAPLAAGEGSTPGHNGTAPRAGVADDGAITLTLSDYRAVGTVADALSDHCDDVFGALSKDQQRIPEVMFRRLTERSAGQRDTRRPTRLSEIAAVAGVSAEAVATVANEFRGADRSFIAPHPPQPLTPETILDISHESLIRQWKTLSKWVDEEESSAAIYQRLKQTAHLWQSGDAALWRTPDLERALEWKEKQKPTLEWATRYTGGQDAQTNFTQAMKGAEPDFALAMKFLEESERQREAELRREEGERQRDKKNATVFKRLSVALGAVVLVAGIAAFMAWQQRQAASTNAAKAEEQARMAKANEAEAKQQKSLAVANAKKARIAEAKAEDQAHIAVGNASRASEQARLAGMRAQEAQRQTEEARRQRQRAEEQKQLALSQSRIAKEQRRIALIQRSEAERQAKIAHARELAVFALLQPDTDLSVLLAVEAVKVSPTEEAKDALRQSLRYGRNVWKQEQSYMSNIYLSPHAKIVATISRGSSVQVYEASSGKLLATLAGLKDYVREIYFSPDSRLLAVSTSEGKVQVYEASSGKLLATLAGLKDRVREIYFSPDSTVIAAITSTQGLTDSESVQFCENVQFCETNSGKFLATVADLKGLVNKVNFSPDSELLAVITIEGGKSVGRLYQASNGKPVDVAGLKDDVFGIDFSSDRKLLAVSLNVGLRAQVYQVSNRKPVLKWIVSKVDFSPDSRLLAVLTIKGEVEVYEASSGKLLATWAGLKDRVSGVYFSPDSRLLAVSTSEGKVQVYEASSGKLLATLAGLKDYVREIYFSPDSKLLAVRPAGRMGRGQRDRVRVHQASNGNLLSALPGLKGEVQSLEFSVDGKLLAVRTTEEVRVYCLTLGSLTLDGLLAEARRTAKRSLTWQERERYLHEPRSQTTSR